MIRRAHLTRWPVSNLRDDVRASSKNKHNDCVGGEASDSIPPQTTVTT